MIWLLFKCSNSLSSVIVLANVYQSVVSKMSEPWQRPNQFFPYSLSVSCGLLRISDRFYLILHILSPADPSAHYPGQPQGLDLLLGAGANHSQVHAALQGPSEVALIQWDGWDHPR